MSFYRGGRLYWIWASIKTRLLLKEIVYMGLTVRFFMLSELADEPSSFQVVKTSWNRKHKNRVFLQCEFANESSILQTL